MDKITIQTPFITKRCGACQSSDVCLEAYAVWNNQQQCWTLGDVYDRSFCRACGAEGNHQDLTFHPLETFGCLFAVIDGALFTCAMHIDGTPDLDDDGGINYAEVTEPVDQCFLDAVNRMAGTTFQLGNFEPDSGGTS